MTSPDIDVVNEYWQVSWLNHPHLLRWVRITTHTFHFYDVISRCLIQMGILNRGWHIVSILYKSWSKFPFRDIGRYNKTRAQRSRLGEPFNLIIIFMSQLPLKMFNSHSMSLHANVLLSKAVSTRSGLKLCIWKATLAVLAPLHMFTLPFNQVVGHANTMNSLLSWDYSADPPQHLCCPLWHILFINDEHDFFPPQ